MEIKQEKPKSGINKTAILVALILGLSVVGYGYMNISYKKQERLAKETEKSQTKQALSSCLVRAEEYYHDQWRKECESQGKLTVDCVSFYEMTFDEYAEQNNIPLDEMLEAIDEFYDKREDCSCRLQLATADRMNETLEKDRDRCFKRYPVE